MTSPTEPELFDFELKHAIDAIAQRIPDDVYDRLGSHRYLPSRRPALRVALVGAPVAAAGAVVAVVVSGFGPGVQTAFAGWSATPTTPVPGQVSAAETTCLASADQTLQRATGMEHSQLGTPQGSFQPVVADTRGPYTLVVMSVTGTLGRENAACLTGPGSLAANPQLTTDTAKVKPPPGPGAVGTTGWGQSGTGTTPGTDTVLLGSVGATVTAVTLSLTNGTTVTASVAKGMYAAWWPGSASPASSVASTATGKTTTHAFSDGTSGLTPTKTTVQYAPGT